MKSTASAALESMGQERRLRCLSRSKQDSQYAKSKCMTGRTLRVFFGREKDRRFRRPENSGT
jgi:hypothetical protein